MLVTGYGIENALAQIIYYHSTFQTDMTTVSTKNIGEFLSVAKPDIVVGLKVPPNSRYLLKPDCVILDNTKISQMYYQELEPVWDNFIHTPQVCRGEILADYLNHRSTTVNLLVKLAKSIYIGNTTAEEDAIQWYYDTIGHDNFIWRFIFNESIYLTPDEKRLVSQYIKVQKTLSQQYIDTFATLVEPFAICRSPYSMQSIIGNALIEKYEGNISCVILWDYTQDGVVKVNAKSMNDLGKRFAEYFDGQSYGRGGTWDYTMEDFKDIEDLTDINSIIVDKCKYAFEKIDENKRREMFDNFQYNVLASDNLNDALGKF